MMQPRRMDEFNLCTAVRGGGQQNGRGSLTVIYLIIFPGSPETRPCQTAGGAIFLAEHKTETNNPRPTSHAGRNFPPHSIRNGPFRGSFLIIVLRGRTISYPPPSTISCPAASQFEQSLPPAAETFLRVRQMLHARPAALQSSQSPIIGGLRAAGSWRPFARDHPPLRGSRPPEAAAND